MKYNTYPIDSWIISEDSGDPSVNSALMQKYPEFTWIHGKRGQIRSIDEAYARVTTPYVLHWEEDWETYAGGFIEESIKILENATVSAVMLRAHGDGSYTPGDPFLECRGGWGYYSFNPGLRRMSDYRAWFPNGFAGAATFDPGCAHSAERTINDVVKLKGFKMALTSRPEGFVRHIGWDRHVGLSIGLCMIVKDESHIIHESLECTLPLIDTYCIVDTGSSDNTIQIIKDFYAKHNIPGTVHERPWKDFGTNRSEALKLCDGAMDYILVIDADDLMTFPKNGKEILKTLLKDNPSNFIVDIHQGTLRYVRSQIFKANDGWHYRGVLHEYPSNGKQPAAARLPPEFWMESRRIGGRNKTGNKLAQDIAVLEKGVQDEPKNERYMFYLAQSYRDSGNAAKAIEWYTKRFEFGGWYEETYVAGLNVTRLTNSKDWAWKTHQANPKRIECLVSYMAHCRATNKWSQELYAMAMYASTIPKPADQLLFLETDVYDWKVWDELSIISFYTGHISDAHRASGKLLENPAVPVEQRARIKANNQFGRTNIVVPICRHSTGNFWEGILSKCSYDGAIVKYIRKTAVGLTVFIEDSDGTVSRSDHSNMTEGCKMHTRLENIDTFPKSGARRIAVLATRNVYHRDIMLLPFDDETFLNGLPFKNLPKWSTRKSQVVWRGKNVDGSIRSAVQALATNMDFKFTTYDKTNFLESIDQCAYKYILSIDGTCIGSSHQWVMGSGAVPILITNSGNNFWFKKHLVHKENCILIHNLDDLLPAIAWLTENDSIAERVAKNALELAGRIFTPEFQRKYIDTELQL